jgi:hypothetical protein
MIKIKYFLSLVLIAFCMNVSADSPLYAHNGYAVAIPPDWEVSSHSDSLIIVPIAKHPTDYANISISTESTRGMPGEKLMEKLQYYETRSNQRGEVVQLEYTNGTGFTLFKEEAWGGFRNIIWVKVVIANNKCYTILAEGPKRYFENHRVKIKEIFDSFET